jgi:hypothetical protein
MGIDVSRLPEEAQRQIRYKLQQQAQSQHKAKPAKYGNVKTKRVTEKKEITFGSMKEASRYDELMFMLKAGEIRKLKLQHEFTLQAAYTTPEGERIRAIRYLADFSYERKVGGHWVPVVEDVKSRPTKTPSYQMKRKLMQERLGIEVVEI